MWLSIQGIYEYDPTVFDGLQAPTYTDPSNVIHTVDINALIKNICFECAELEVIYPSPTTMKLAIGVWSASNEDAWNKLYASQIIKYNPIWNVDADISTGRTDTNKVAGYNSESWSNANQLESYFTERRTGNIGVTATQDLLKKEREIADFSIINYITQSFKERFCLMVY